MKRLKGRPAGFSMLEVMVSLVLLTIALLGTAPLLTSSVVSDTQSRTGSCAATLAEAKTEQLRSIGYADVMDGNDNVTVDGAVYARSWVIADVTPGVLKKLTVTVAWGPHNDQLSISSYMAKQS